MSLVVLNLEQAKFDCTFGRGCDGICCRNGRPPVYADEAERIDRNLQKFLPEMRAEARSLAQADGYLSNRRKDGQRLMRVVGGWCVFFNDGCTLHKAGAREGEAHRYKPAACAFFPLAKDQKDRWYVRQKAYKGEIWDLFCLDPEASKVPAAQSLTKELALVETLAEAR